MASKQKVFALAKKHNIEIEGGTDMYWKTAECEWYAPEGKSFGHGRHCSVMEADLGYDVKDAKTFWSNMFNDLKKDIEYLGSCNCRDCVEDCQ